MALSRDYKQTVIERAERDPAFAQALLDEAATLFLNGEPETARLILRELVNATLGFEQLGRTFDGSSSRRRRRSIECLCFGIDLSAPTTSCMRFAAMTLSSWASCPARRTRCGR